MQPQITRFAPSPSGLLHLGVARTALFNYLLAKSSGGRFLLRIEDSHQERSEKRFEEEIQSALGWLGIQWDGFSRLSDAQNEALHEQACQSLIVKGHAYWCHCDDARLAALREAQMKRSQPPGYDGECADKGLGSNPNAVLRFRTKDEGTTEFRDGIRGEMSFRNDTIKDFVIKRSDGSFTYQLCAVVNDHSTGVTLVARGEDLLPSTPRQILIYEALNWEIPGFAHLPLVNGTDGKRLSKRLNAEPILALRERGYLPQAVVNQLARLGWSHGDQEVFTEEELIQHFGLDAVGKAAAIYDPKHLDWLNREFLRTKPAQEILALWSELALPIPAAESIVIEAIELARGQSANLVGLHAAVQRLIQVPEQVSLGDRQVEVIKRVEVTLRNLSADEWQAENLHETVDSLVKEYDGKFALVGKPVRLALTGESSGPPLDALLKFVGRDETLSRLQICLKAS